MTTPLDDSVDVPAEQNEDPAVNPADDSVQVAPQQDAPPGVVPIPPPEGWTKAITVNKKWTAFEIAWMDENLQFYRNKQGEDRRKLVRWVQRGIHTYWGTTYNNNAMRDRTVKKRWEKRKDVCVCIIIQMINILKIISP